MSLISREDMFSALPDSIICHILSFLPTKDSATTSILSKRWKPLWLLVLDLDFYIQPFLDITTFRRVLYSLIVSRHITLPIRSLRLQRFLGYETNVCQIDEFVDAAIQRRVETLALDMEYESLHTSLASNIFSCKTLTFLELKQIIVRDLPQINIPQLKSLHLDSVFFTLHKDIIDFLLGCPALEELQTNRVYVAQRLTKFNPETGIVKCLPNLLRATICTKAIPFFLISRAQILTLKLTLAFHFKVPTFHNLTKMEVFFNLLNLTCKTWRDKWMWMLEVLQQSPKLQRLIIHEEETKEIENRFYEDNWEEPQVVPECLSSQLKTCLFTNCRGRECELQFAEYVMLNSKVLRTMTIRTASFIDLKTKYQILKKLAVCSRGCNLIFD